MSPSTPFFEAFGPLLFGRKPGSKLKELKQIQSLGELYEVFEIRFPRSCLAALSVNQQSERHCRRG